MTREEIEGLRAGEELNMLVAELVMGWQWKERTDEPDAWLFPPDSYDCETGKKGIFDEPVIERRTKTQWLGIGGPFKDYAGGKKHRACFTLPYYSTDIAAAWQVLEKFPAIVIQRATSGDGSTVGYRCSLPLEPNIERLAGLQRATIDADAATAPLAICKAALLVSI